MLSLYVSCKCTWCCCWSLLYSAILHSQADSLQLHVILHVWLAFYSTFLNIHHSGVLNGTDMAGATWNCCCLGVFCVHHTTMHHVTSCKNTYVHACLNVTCHLRFWQNDLDLLHATAVTRNMMSQQKYFLKLLLWFSLAGLRAGGCSPWDVQSVWSWMVGGSNTAARH